MELKKGYDAYKDSNEAEILHEEAKYEYELNERYLNDKKEKAQRLFRELGNLKKSVVEQELAAYCTLIDKLNIKEQKELKEILKEFDLNKLKQARDNITNLQAALGGLAGGAMAGFGAIDTIVGILGQIFQSIAGKLKAIWKSIRTAAKSMFNAIYDYITGKISSFERL